ncbi:MAG: sugar ABC transporter ATP-binding protein [Spirochaetes bacterium]|nr:sugar ABC transporter ATP-binding protein [Spirochaetota bacterium]
MNGEAIVKVEGVGKSFGATRALDGVSCEFRRGEITALVGANGAGKSTLIKIICGYYEDYEGDIMVAGNRARFQSTKDAYKNGIQTVHQSINQGVVQNMTVAENLALEYLLSDECRFFVDNGEILARARAIAEPMGLGDMDLGRKVEDLSQSERQLLVIARAIASDPALLILDEPTSSISERETEILFEKLAMLRDRGVAILYVSHRLHEITRIADRVYAMRDGRISSMLEKPFHVKQIVTAMVGTVKEKLDRACGAASCAEPSLELRDLVVEEGNRPLNLTVRRGEVLGITGLIGAGKTELAEVLFGIRKPVSGSVLIDGVERSFDSIRDAIDAGVHLVPEDRANNAVVNDFSIRHNITVPFLRDYSSFGMMRRGRERKRAEELVSSIGVKCSGESADIDSLSGGNQQKVVVARWLVRDFKVLILDEPFQGVDIKSRRDIGEYIRANTGAGSAIVLATDLDEIIEIADRIVVMNSGMIAGEQGADAIDRDLLLHWTSQRPEELVQERA